MFAPSIVARTTTMESYRGVLARAVARLFSKLIFLPHKIRPILFGVPTVLALSLPCLGITMAIYKYLIFLQSAVFRGRKGRA